MKALNLCMYGSLHLERRSATILSRDVKSMYMSLEVKKSVNLYPSLSSLNLIFLFPVIQYSLCIQLLLCFIFIVAHFGMPNFIQIPVLSSGWHSCHQSCLQPLRPRIDSLAPHVGCNLSINFNLTWRVFSGYSSFSSSAYSAFTPRSEPSSDSTVSG